MYIRYHINFIKFLIVLHCSTTSWDNPRRLSHDIHNAPHFFITFNYTSYKQVIKYCEKVYERSGINLFWSIKKSGEILDKLKARDCAPLVADLFLFVMRGTL